MRGGGATRCILWAAGKLERVEARLIMWPACSQARRHGEGRGGEGGVGARHKERREGKGPGTRRGGRGQRGLRKISELLDAAGGGGSVDAAIPCTLLNTCSNQNKVVNLLMENLLWAAYGRMA